ncbi:MAG: cobalamin-binding protein [Clostridia bacterium]|nr:cobalamin-binding protein [Clostridia bacterium]
MRNARVFILVLLSLFLLTGCGAQEDLQNGHRAGEVNSFPMVVTDDLGREVEIVKAPERIVSLAPAATEILFSLDLDGLLVGVTDYCDYPLEAKNKEKIGDFLNPNLEKILSMEPDLILAAGGVQEGIVNQLDNLGEIVVVLDPQNLGEVMEDILLVGKITARMEEALRVTGDMEARIQRVKDVTGNLSEDEIVDTFVVLWIEGASIYTAGGGSFISHLVELAGGCNIADTGTGDYFQYSLENLLEEDPEAIINIALGYDGEDLGKMEGWEKLRAVQNGRIHTVDDNDLLTLPGPRLIEGLELLSQFLHPEYFLP